VLKFGQEYPCDDQNPCTHDVCFLDGNCQNDPLPNNTLCSFNNKGGDDELIQGLCKNGNCIEAQTNPDLP